MKRRNQLIAIVLIAAMTLGLGGCRYSDTIEEIIYNQFLNGLIDYEPPFDVKDDQEDNEEEDDEIPEKEQSDNSDREQETTRAGILSDYISEDAGYEVVYSEDGTSDVEVEVAVESDEGEVTDEELAQSSETEEDGTAENVNDTSEEGEEGVDDAGEDGDTGTENGSGDEEGEGEGQASKKETTYKKIVDSSGKKVSVPEGIETVAAIGETAIMISILRAGESVVATDASTLNLAKNGAGSSVISDLSGASALWDGDGSDGIDSDDFKTLLELSPDLVIEISGTNTLTDAQVEKLEDNDISYMALPALDSFDDVEDSMDLLGQLYEGTDYEEAGDWADDYISFAEDTVLKTVKSVTKSSSYYTLFVDAWDSSAKCSVVATGGTTTLSGGTAVVKNIVYTETAFITDMLSYSNVTNNISGYGVSSSTNKKFKYFCPLRTWTSSLSISGGSLATDTYPKSYKFLEPSDSVSLGTGSFPAVIAADEDVAEGIEASRDSGNGQWTVYPYISNSSDGYSGDGFTDKSGNLVTTQISGNYDILENPSGFDTWAEGSCESVLESAWAAWKIADELDRDDVTGYITEFYSTFYDYQLTSSEIKNILNE